MRIVSEDNFFRLGLSEALKIHDNGLRDVTISLSADLKTIRLYKNIFAYSNERFFIPNCLAGFILSHQLSDGLKLLHHNLFKLISEKKITYLTPREIEVMGALLKGNNITDISRLRGLSPKTISAQKNSALKKLKVGNLPILHRDLGVFKILFYKEYRGHENFDLS